MSSKDRRYIRIFSTAFRYDGTELLLSFVDAFMTLMSGSVIVAVHISTPTASLWGQCHISPSPSASGGSCHAMGKLHTHAQHANIRKRQNCKICHLLVVSGLAYCDVKMGVNMR